MNISATRRTLAAFLLAIALFVGGCQSPASQTPPPPPAEQVQPADGRGAVAEEAVAGGEFNKFFPEAGDGYSRVYTQEKTGFAEAKLTQDGDDLAMLAISDTSSVPAAAAKFDNSEMQIAGYPAVTVGTTQTAILVGDRFQVKVISRSPDFTASDRETWLQKFDLQGLSQLK